MCFGLENCFFFSTLAIMTNAMDQQPTTSLKRSAEASDDCSEPPSKKRSAVLPDLRTRRSARPNELQFVKGGTVNDPLNLNSVRPEDLKSPDKPVELILPRNLRDPLNINQSQLAKKKKYFPHLNLTNIFFRKKKDEIDEDLIVSPVIPAQV